MKSLTSLLNHRLQPENSLLEQILSVKNKCSIGESPILSLILSWICNKAKAVSSFEFKYSFFTMLNLLVFLGISFLQCFISVARLSLALLKTQGCRDLLDSLAAWYAYIRCNFSPKESNGQMRRLYTHAAWMTTLLILLQYEFETKKIHFFVADFEERKDNVTSI